jgi:hypothetical protein
MVVIISPSVLSLQNNSSRSLQCLQNGIKEIQVKQQQAK